MEQQTQISQSETIKEDRKVQAENMRLKKYIKELEEKNAALIKFIGGVL